MDNELKNPKRHKAAGSGVVRTDPKGDLVLYSDYVRLLAEVNELKSQPDPLTSCLYAAELAKDDINRLKAQVERLTKAGYAMAVKINVHGINDRFTDSQKLVNDWSNAAKEVQS